MNVAWIGVDPGARYTGVVGCHEGVATWTVIDREHHGQRYLKTIEQAIHDAWYDLASFSPSVAIEDINAPSPHMGLARPADLIALGRTIGYLQHAFPAAILIPPNKHGSRPWGTYPAQLLTPRERANAKAKPLATAGQSSLMRHARSAYDVAQAAPLAARLHAARRPA